MLNIVLILLPVLLIIAIGHLITRYGMMNDAHWHGVETLSYYIFFPAIVITSLYKVDFNSLPTFALSATLFLTIITASILLLGLRFFLKRFLKMDRPAFSSLFQGVTRWNTFAALAIAASLYGDEALALMAIAIVAMIPILNIINVTILSVYAHGGFPPILILLKQLAFNPLIWSCALGMALNLLHIPLPHFTLATLDLLGNAALATGLLAIGGGLRLAKLHKPNRIIVASVILRLIFMPALAFLFAEIFALSSVALNVALISFGVPTASASYILARKMGGDAPLMADIITTQTIVALLTLPIILAMVAAV